MCKSVCYCRFFSSYAGQEVRHSHGSRDLVAPLHAAVLAECEIVASVNQRLVGIVVVLEQTLLELALVVEDCLQGTEKGKTFVIMTGAGRMQP